ncbi:hypothetical protein I4U23_005022 [Adineta vaga]|nr:hypothetical protein I4U23_005022 [Adineta vaga]
MYLHQYTIIFLVFLRLIQVHSDPTTVLNNVKLIIEATKQAKNVWDFVRDLLPTLGDYLTALVAGKNINASGKPVSSYDFVVDLTRPTDIFGKLKSYPLVYPAGKDAYDKKLQGNERNISRFVVNIVGRYNVGKTFILRLLANINLDHSFTERTNGLSVALPLLSDTDNVPLALIDTAGTRTPVEYSDELIDNGLSPTDIEQRLLLVHNYFNLHTIDEVEKTENHELVKLFGARKQPQGFWLSDKFKHFVIACVDSVAGKKYNDLAIEQIRSMIRGANAAKNSDILNTIIRKIEILLSKVLVEESPVKSYNGIKDSQQSFLKSLASGILAKISSNREKPIKVMPQRHVNVQLEVQELSLDKEQLLWFICPRSTLAANITLSKNLKFAEDGSVRVDYSSHFVSGVKVFQFENGNIQIEVECPSL